jgi:hypothetical protein
MRDLEPGDIVRCRSTDYASELGVADQIGVTLEPRSAHCLVFFAGLDVSYWIPGHGLVRTDAAPSARGAELKLLRDVLGLFHATEVEVEVASVTELVLAVNHDTLTFETATKIRQRIGDALETFAIGPGGMAFMTTTLEIRRAAIIE